MSDDKAENGKRECAVSGCDGTHYAKDYCKKHYTQILRHGKLTPDRERGILRECKVAGCGRTDTIQDDCRKHARQLRVHGRLTPEREHMMGFEGCRVPRCTEPHRAKGFCAKHYNADRWRRISTKGGAKKRPAAARRGGARKKAKKA